MPLHNHKRPHLAIMGIRGVPAAHGGFESFAERLAPFLAAAGWRVTVYCQEDGDGAIYDSMWGEVHRVHIPSGEDTPMASIRFDWDCISHAKKHRPDVTLILGYNTAVFAARLRLAGIPTVFNMDGLEWSRAKWGPLAKAWLYFNERMGCLLGQHLIADHPVIGEHLATRVSASKITVIPYGGAEVAGADAELLRPLRLVPGKFVTVIARAEPENSVLEIVRAFSARRRDMTLVVLGKYQATHSEFHRRVLAAASEEVIFPGAIYDEALVTALRVFSHFYVHGHQVGGTNPSLLEAMACGNAVLAHDNAFNRWVAGEGALYFRDRVTCLVIMDRLLAGDPELEKMRAHNRERVRTVFDWRKVLEAYAQILQAVAVSSDASEVAGQGNLAWTQYKT